MNLLGALLALLLTALLLFASPWWPADQICALVGEGFPCARPGLFGQDWLHWRGDWVARWLNGTPLQESALMAWLVGGFLSLTLVERLWGLPRR